MKDHVRQKQITLGAQSLRAAFVSTVVLALVAGGWLAVRELQKTSGVDTVAGTDVQLTTGQHIATVSTTSESIQLMFVGDLMFDRGIRQIAAYRGYAVFAAAITELAQEADVVVGNLEGPITDYPSKSIMTTAEGGRDHYTFTFAPVVADLLATSGVQVVSLANNHASDFGTEGVMRTKHALTQAGISYFGDPTDVGHHARTIKHDGISVTLVGFNQFGSPNEEDTIRAIERARYVSDAVIVMPHWGEEYTDDITEEQRRLARRFVDAGADLIVGAHPHVIQSHEIYHGTPIYYSLGNAIFDQWFSPEVSCGMALTIDYAPGRELVLAERYMFSTSRGTRVVEVCPDTLQ